MYGEHMVGLGGDAVVVATLLALAAYPAVRLGIRDGRRD